MKHDVRDCQIEPIFCHGSYKLGEWLGKRYASMPTLKTEGIHALPVFNHKHHRQRVNYEDASILEPFLCGCHGYIGICFWHFQHTPRKFLFSFVSLLTYHPWHECFPQTKMLNRVHICQITGRKWTCVISLFWIRKLAFFKLFMSTQNILELT